MNTITASRLALAVAVAALTPWSADQQWAIVLSTGLVFCIELSDVVDGYLARRHNAVSPFGKVFDPYTDSLSRITVYWSLAVVGRCLVFVPLVMAVRDVSVAYLRILMFRRGSDAAARTPGKIKAVVQGLCAVALMGGPLYWQGWAEQSRAWLVQGMSYAVVFVTLGSLAYYGLITLGPVRESE